MNRRRSVHFRGATRPSHRRGMGVEWAWVPIPWQWTLKIRWRFIDAHLWFFILKNVAVLMTSHITWRHQYSAKVYLKIKVCMDWVSEFETLHFNTLHDHYSTVLTTLHCTTTTPLHCTHYTAPPLLHYTALTTLHCTHYTALHSLHCTVLTTLHCTYCTVITTLHHQTPSKMLGQKAC